MFNKFYKFVMNPDYNPLRHLKRKTAFQLMVVLSWMWSFLFTIMIGSMMVFGPTMIIHIAFLTGIFFTARIFKAAEEKDVVSYDQQFKDPEDGCAMYDDVWGAQ